MDYSSASLSVAHRAVLSDVRLLFLCGMASMLCF